MITVSEAIEMALRHSMAQADHIRNQRRAVKQFERFMGARYPELVQWCDMRQYHVADFIRELMQTGHAPATVRLYVNPICVTQAFLEDNLPEMTVPMKLRKLLPSVPLQPRRYLSGLQVVRLIKHCVSRKHYAAALGFALAGLGGLRLTEIMRLNGDSLRGDVVTIVQTKNDASRRCIPLCEMALDVMREHIGRQRGNRPQFYRRTDNFSHRMRWMLNEMAGETGEMEYAECAPHEGGRKSFVNLCRDADVSVDWIKTYLGHAPGSIAERHYWHGAPRPDESVTIRERGLAVLRERIIGPLEKKLHGVADCA